MNQETPLAKANSAFRQQRYDVALQIYEGLLSENLPKTLLDSIRKNIEFCRKRLPEISCASLSDNAWNSNQFILLVNPSHGHPTEVEFWSDFSKELTGQGYKVIDFAFRKSDPFPNSHMALHPARAHDLAKRLENYDDLPMPAWANDALIDLTVDWEHRRWQLAKYTPESRIGTIRLIKYVDHVITTLRPAAILTTNKIDPPNHFAFIAAKHYGIPYRFLERSPLNTYLLENSGMFSEADTVERIVGELLKNGAVVGCKEDSTRLLQTILGNPYGFRADEANRTGYHKSSADSAPLFFLPMDNALWTGWAQPEHPQGDVDYPVFRRPELAIGELARAVSAVGGRLVVKPHPSCKEWTRVAKAVEGVEFSEADLDQLCSEADVIVTFLTKVSYLGLAKGKPVLSFGGGLLDHLGVTYQVKSKIELMERLRQALNKKDLQNKIERFFALLPVLEKGFVATGEMAASNLAKEICFSKKLSEQDVKQKLDGAFKRSATRKIKTAIQLNARVGAPIVVFDVSRLLNNKLRHSGVSRYITALLDGLLADVRVQVFLGYEAQNNEFGMSAYYCQALQRDLGVKLFPMKDLLSGLDAIGCPYVYHSPIAPLPDWEKHPKMHRVITVHDIFHLTRPEFYSKGNFITADIVRSIDPQRDGIIFVSEFSRNEFSAYVGKQLISSVVVPLAVDGAFSRSGVGKNVKAGWGIPANAKILVAPCQGDPRKGFPRMVSLALNWLEKDDSRYLVVFGKKESRGWFSELIESHTVRSRCVYLQDISDEDLAALYRGAAAQLYLSEAEGFGLPPMEAMSCGCPSILLANTSLAEVYKDWKYTLPADVTDAKLLDVMEEVLLDKDAAEMAYDYSNKFSWANTTAATVDYYVQEACRMTR